MDRATFFTENESYVSYVSNNFGDDFAEHPCKVVEASTLAHTNPPPLNFKLNILKYEKQVKGKHAAVSRVQLEAIAAACQKHEEMLPSGERAGFFLGDSTGLGKGRTIAGLIWENSTRGRTTSVWVTVSSDLFHACQKDLDAFKVGLEGVPWYSRQGRTSKEIPNFFGKTLLITYCTLTSRNGDSLEALITYLGRKFEGLVILDESQRAKGNLKTQTGTMVIQLQERLPLSRVVYSSATGGSNPTEICYMSRLGLWGQMHAFPNVKTFVTEMHARGTSSMEALAINLKKNGFYLARNLSTEGITFDKIVADRDPKFDKLYDDCAQLFSDIAELLYKYKTEEQMYNQRQIAGFWSAHQLFFSNLCLSSKIKCAAEFGKSQVRENKCVVFGLQSTGEACYQEVLKTGNPCVAFSSARTSLEKLLYTLNIMRRVTRKVVPVVNTKNVSSSSSEGSSSESSDSSSGTSTSSSSDGSSSDGSSSDGSSSESSDSSDTSSSTSSSESSSDDEGDSKSRTDADKNINSNRISESNKISYQELSPFVVDAKKIEAKFNRIKDDLPMNPLDDLIEQLGGHSMVAEMTGRRKRQELRHGLYYESTRNVISRKPKQDTKIPNAKSNKMGQVPPESDGRSANLVEKDNFQNGLKHYALISEATSTGFSLHADKTVCKNPRRRVHVSLQLPWSSEKFIQQLGRTHRSGQASAPEHRFISSGIPGEDRFIYAIQQRINSLNAMTQGDRNAPRQQQVSTDIISTEVGDKALHRFMENLHGDLPFHFTLSFENFELIKNGLDAVGIKPTENLDCRKFLNRVLGMPIEIQNLTLSAFYKVLDHIVLDLRRRKFYHHGILEIGFPNGSETVLIGSLSIPKVLPKVVVHHIEICLGLSYTQLKRIISTKIKMSKGNYYKFENENGINAHVIYTYQDDFGETVAISPNNCEPVNFKTKEMESYNKIDNNAAEILWNREHNKMEDCSCIHEFLDGDCENVGCIDGAMYRSIIILSGDLNSAWSIISQLTEQQSPSIVKLRISDGTMFVGVALDCIDEDFACNLKCELSRHYDQDASQSLGGVLKRKKESKTKPKIVKENKDHSNTLNAKKKIKMQVK